jgi:hypothetical protein
MSVPFECACLRVEGSPQKPSAVLIPASFQSLSVVRERMLLIQHPTPGAWSFYVHRSFF